MTIDAARLTTLPPGPKLPTSVQTLLFGTARHWFFPAMQRRYGDTFKVRIAPGWTMVVIADPEDIRTVFSGSSSVFHAGAANGPLKPLLGGEHSVLLTDQDEHKRLRRLVMPAFTGAALRGYQDMMQQLIVAEVQRWPTGQSFRALDRMYALTLEVILHTVFGVTEPTRLAELRPMFKYLVNAHQIAMFGWFFPALERLGPWRRFRAKQQLLDRWLYAEIANRRQASGLAERTDVLSRLLQQQDDTEALSDVELRDQLVTLLLAGHETTAVALGWALHELAHRPDLLRAAQQAADENNEEYLTAVIKETMRLHPVLYAIGRRLAEPTQIGDYLLPRETVVVPAIGLVQQDARHHPAPAEFRPERFLGDQPAANTWIPFGGGVRRCLGAGFALLESVAVLREVLTRYDLHATRLRPESTKVHAVTMIPASGARIVVTPRTAKE